MSWEDKLPSKVGILCWVWNSNDPSINRRKELVTHIEGGTFCYSGGYSYHAKPVDEGVKMKYKKITLQEALEIKIAGDDLYFYDEDSYLLTTNSNICINYEYYVKQDPETIWATKRKIHHPQSFSNEQAAKNIAIDNYEYDYIAKEFVEVIRD